MTFLLSKAEWISVGKGLLIAVAGATATYLTQLAVSGDFDFGPTTPMVVAGFSVLVNYIRKGIAHLEGPTVK